MKYRERPVIVEAERWFPGKKISGVVEQDRVVGSFYTHAWISISEVVTTVRGGDWILTNALGYKSVITDREFRYRYEPILDSAAIGFSTDGLEPTDISKEETAILLRPVEGRDS